MFDVIVLLKSQLRLLFNMKLRLKGKAFNKPELTVFDSDNITVAELKKRVGEILKIETKDEDFFGSLQLSLNGKEPIVTNDTDLLTSLDIVSGDVVYILNSSSTSLTESRTPKFPKLNSNEPACFEKNNQPSSSKTQNMDAKDWCSDVKAQTSNLSIESYHIPLADTPDSLIPISYENLISANPTLLQSPLEKLGGLLHILMIETGFSPQSSNISSNPFNTLPESWSMKHGNLKLNYKTRSQSPCTILISAIGPVVNVQAIIGPGKLLSLKLKLDNFIPPIGGRSLKMLSVDFKNEISFPLYVHIERETNGACPAHFSNLPPEILYNILQRLDFKSLCQLSTTSRLFENLANQPSLWKRLVLRDLGQRFATPPVETPDWKKLYKDETVLARKNKEVSRRIRVMPHIPPPFLPGPLLPSPRIYPGFGEPDNFPGLVGGYSDLYPDLRGFGPPGRRAPFQGLGDMGFVRPRGGFRGFPPF